MYRLAPIPGRGPWQVEINSSAISLYLPGLHHLEGLFPLHLVKAAETPVVTLILVTSHLPESSVPPQHASLVPRFV